MGPVLSLRQGVSPPRNTSELVSGWHWLPGHQRSTTPSGSSLEGSAYSRALSLLRVTGRGLSYGEGWGGAWESHAHPVPVFPRGACRGLWLITSAQSPTCGQAGVRRVPRGPRAATEGGVWMACFPDAEVTCSECGRHEEPDRLPGMTTALGLLSCHLLPLPSSPPAISIAQGLWISAQRRSLLPVLIADLRTRLLIPLFQMKMRGP